MEKLIVATKYHNIVGLLDTHLNQGEVNVMIKENKTFFQDFHEPLLIPSKTRGIMVLIRKTCPFSLIRHYEVTPNCLSVKMVSTSNQEFEIAFVYNPNDEIESLQVMYLLCCLHKVQMLASDNLRLGIFPSRLLLYWTYYSDGAVTLFIWYQNTLFIRTVDLGRLNDQTDQPTNSQTTKHLSTLGY